jgi:hypothetical protein
MSMEKYVLPPALLPRFFVRIEIEVEDGKDKEGKEKRKERPPQGRLFLCRVCATL